MTQIDAVLIPGGGLLPTGAVVPWVQSRLERAIALRPRPRFFIPLSAGTTHKPPPLDEAGFPIAESIAAAQYLLARGVAGAQILPETISLDTIGNAYFARVQHVEPLQLQRLHTVTSAFHLPRTQAIFEWVFGLPPHATAFHLTFESVPNVGLTAAVLQARTKREGASLATVQPLQRQLTTLSALHQWLYTEHAAYAIAKTPQRLHSAALESY
ncbi:MAG: YdcF family protein [Cyanobacteria bacterium P01_C01_bin.120]